MLLKQLATATEIGRKINAFKVSKVNRSGTKSKSEFSPPCF